MKATEQYFSVVLFIILQKAVPTFEFVVEIKSMIIQTKLSCWAVISCGNVSVSFLTFYSQIKN